MEENERDQQQMLQRLIMIQQQAEQIGKQMDAVEHGIKDLAELREGILALKGRKGQEVLANIGRGISIKTELKDESLFVDIGNKKIIKKTIPETAEIIDKQILELTKMHEDMKEHLEKMQEQADKIVG